MDTLDQTYDKLICEIADINKKEKMQVQDVDVLYKIVDIVKDIDEIHSYRDTEYSNMRGRSYGRNNYNGYSRRNNYSRDDSKDMMLDHLQEVADMAIDERDRKAVEKLMQQMQQN